MICLHRALRGLLAVALWFAASLALAQSPLDVPTLTARVIDQTGTLTAEQHQALVDKLAAFDARKGSQIAVLIVPTTQPEDIAAYTNRVANAWKIGRKDVGDGLLFVVAKNDRKLRIEVAKTLEGAITDLQAKRVIDQTITPRFKQGDFAGGISSGLDALIRLVDGESLPEPAPTSDSAPDSPLRDVLTLWLVLYGFLTVVIFSVAGVRQGAKASALLFGIGSVFIFTTWLVTHDPMPTHIAGAAGILVSLFANANLFDSKRVSRITRSRSNLLDDLISAAGSTYSSSYSSSSSDSFSSGGGGDFGGGGASGDW
jgi:uncharacterized protein